MTGRIRALACAALLCVFTLPAYASNGIEDIGATTVQLGRGGAFIASEPDCGALQGNPAALAFLEGPEAYFDARLWHSTLDYTGALNGIGQKENYVIPSAAYATPVNSRLAWGAGVFTTVNSAYRVTDYDLSLAGAPPGTTDRTSTKVRFVVLTPGLAYKLTDSTAVGVAVNYTSGTADFQAYDFLGNTLGYRLDKPSGKGHSVRAGIYHVADKNTTLGAYWRSRTHLKIDDGVLEMGLLSEGAGAQIPGTSIVGYQFPEQYGAGLSRRLGCEWTVQAEYRRLLWGKGSDTVSFVPSVGDPIGLAMAWTDQDVYVLGAEYRPGGGERVWRCGVNYAETCVPDSTLSPMYPAINEIHYTCGWEGPINDRLSLAASAVYSPEVSRTSAEGNPFNQALGLGQPYTLATENLELGIGLTWKLGGGGKDCCEDEAACEDCDGGDGEHHSGQEFIDEVRSS